MLATLSKQSFVLVSRQFGQACTELCYWVGILHAEFEPDYGICFFSNLVRDLNT